MERHRPELQRVSDVERIEQSLMVSFLYEFERRVVLITSALLVSLKFLAVESLLSQYFRNRVVPEEA